MFDGDRWSINNYGVGGRTLAQVKAYQRTNAYEQALRDGFDVLIVNIGTNDCQDAYVRRADLPLMNRGDAAAATRIFL